MTIFGPMSSSLLQVVVGVSILPALAASQFGSVEIHQLQQQQQQGSSNDDFEAFNSIFDGASIIIPETFEVSERVGIATLDMTITNLVCYEMAVGDVTVDHQQVSSSQFIVDIGLYQLDLKCELNYIYSYGVLNGDGWVQIATNNNMAQSVLSFESPDFDTTPPQSSSIDSCIADVEISRMDFEEDFASEVLEVFQGLVRGTVERAIGDVACSELSSIGTSLVANMVDLAGQNLDQYRGALDEGFTDPLYLERNIDIPNTLIPLNLQDTAGDVGRTFNQLLLALDQYLGTSVPHPSKTTTGGDDLAVNVLLRSVFLDDDRALVVDPALLEMKTLLFEGHDRLTQFSITLNQVKLFGLDTFTRFNPFRSIGRHTIQNELTLDNLTLEFNVTIEVKPSTLDDAILQDPTSPSISEQVSVAMTVENIDIEASILLLLDEEKLGSLELGPFFYSENILPCIFSVVHEAQFSGLDVDPMYVGEPKLSGFISPGLDRVITDSMHGAFAMYAGVLQEAIPNVFQTSIRTLINRVVIDPFMYNASSKICPHVQAPKGFIDFPKFLDAEKTSYGDVPSLLKKMLDKELLSTVNQTINPAINHVMLAPLTSMQSGIPGTFIFSEGLLGFSSSNVSQFGLQSFEVGINNIRIENLDSMTAPLAILQPNSSHGMILENYARMGMPNKKLRMGFDAVFASKSNIDKELVMSNTVNLAVEMERLDVFISLLAKIDASSLYMMPIKDILNGECWLANIAAPVINDVGQVLQRSGFSIESLLLTMGTMNFNMGCLDCTSTSLSIIPEVVSSLDTAGILDVVQQPFVDLALELVLSNFTQNYFDRLLADAALQCPNSPAYVSPTASAGVEVNEFPPLQSRSLETIAFAAAIAFEVGLVVAAEAHQDFDPAASKPLSAQESFNPPDEIQLVDFTSLGTSIGSWAESGFNGFLSYLTEITADPSGPNGSDLRVNNLLRSSILNEDRTFTIRLLDQVNTLLGMDVQFKKLTILGLDTISEMKTLDAIGPQTLQNNVKWDKLGLQFVASLESATNNGKDRAQTSSSDVILTLELADVSLSLSAFLAIGFDLLGSLELQSVLHLQNILPCLLSAAYNASVTELDVSAGSISSFTIEGFQSEDFIEASEKSTRLVLNQYGPKILESIPGIFDSTTRRIINHWLSYYVTSAMPSFCKSSVSEEDKDRFFVDLRDLLWSAAAAKQLGGTGLSQYGDLFYTAMGWVQNLLKVDQTTRLSSLNGVVVDPLTEDGSIVHSGDIFNGVTPVEVGALNAAFGLRVYDARVDNLDTIGAPLQLFEGLEGKPNLLNNTLTLGVHDKPFQISSKFHLFLEGAGTDDIQINNVIGLSLKMKNTSFIISTMTQIAESRFFGFPLRDVLNINCWLATIPAPDLNNQGTRLATQDPTAALSHLEAFVSELVMQADCLNCSSSRMEELTSILSSQEAQEEIRHVTNQFLNHVTSLMSQTYLQTSIDRLLNDASRKCPHSQKYDPDFEPVAYDPLESPKASYSMHYLILLTGLLLALLISATIVFIGVRVVVRRRHKRWIMKLPAHQLKQLACQQKNNEGVEKYLNSVTSSLFLSPEVPLMLRYGMPLILLLNIALFLSGHLSLGATVNIQAEIAGERFHIDKFFEFSIAQSIGEVWQAGGKELAFLLLVFSGIWPYTKLLMMLAVWFIQPSSLSSSQRGSILLWLDYLGKWSTVDIFVIIISIAAFRVSIQSPNTSYLPSDFYTIEMMVIPMWGLYANMTAQILSQITSSFLIHYHRKVVSHGLALIISEGNTGQEVPNGHNFTTSSSSSRNVQGAPVLGVAACISSKPKGGTVVQGIPPLAPSICIDSKPFAKQVAAAMPESTKVEKVTPESFGESSCTSSSLEDIPICERDHLPVRSISSEEGAIPLCHHQFSRPHRGETEKLVARQCVNKFLIASAVLMTLLLIIGCTLPSFALEIFGIVGVAIEFGQDFEEASTAHSIFSVIVLLFEQAAYLGTVKDYIGLGVLSVLFLSTVLIVPLILAVLLLRQWFSKSTKRETLKRSILIEILLAWQYMEVYLVAVFVSSWQLGPISNSIINGYCNNLKQMFAQLAYFGALKEEDAQCFSVTSSIENGSFVLVAAAITLGFLGSFVGKAAAQYLHDESEADLRVQDDVNNKSAQFSDQTSRTEDESDQLPESGFDAKIHPVPVLFTDSFRWLLRSNTQASSSASVLFTNADNAHWALPEARAVIGETMNDDLTPQKKARQSNISGQKSQSTGRAAAAAAARDLQWERDDSLSSFSTSRDFIPAKKLRYDDLEDEENQPNTVDLDDRKPAALSSIPSNADYSTIGCQMDSIGSSFCDEVSVGSAIDSLAYSYPSEALSSVKTPLPPIFSKSSLYPSLEEMSPSPLSISTASIRRKAPPPSSYCLTTNKLYLKKPPGGSPFSESSSNSTSHHIFEDVDDGESNRGSVRRSRLNSKKDPPLSYSRASPPTMHSTAADTSSPGSFASMLQQQQRLFQNAVANDDGGTTIDSGFDDQDGNTAKSSDVDGNSLTVSSRRSFV